MISAFIVLTLVIGVFAFTLGNMSHTQEGMGCVASMVQGTECPQEGNAFSSLFFHLRAFENVSQGILGSLVTIIGLLILTAVFLEYRKRGGLHRIQRRKEGCAFYFAFSFCLETSIVSWLAFHENSPAYR